MIAAIILAAGKGTRMKSGEVNKVTTLFRGKPLIKYGIELLTPITNEITVVVGAKAQSVKEILLDYSVSYVNQSEQLGTGHAVQIAYAELLKRNNGYDAIIVGYGDHMIFYTPEIIRELIAQYTEENAAISLISSRIENIRDYAFGRIIRNRDGYVEAIRENKNATEKEKDITEFNAGLYIFRDSFLEKYIKTLQINPVSHEYYLTDLVEIARQNNEKVTALEVNFKYVGIGVNTEEELKINDEIKN